jgi:hypothetical protein
MIASSMNVMTFALMARPEIRNVEELKGKKSAFHASAQPLTLVCGMLKENGRSSGSATLR